MKILKDRRHVHSDVLNCFVALFNKREMEKKDMNPDYRFAVMVESFFINKLCFCVNPMRGRKHRMINEKNLFGQFHYHYKDNHGLRFDSAFDLFHDMLFISFYDNNNVVFQVSPTGSSMFPRQHPLLHHQ